ncbi:MAG: T9SS type A sorting domain-containing protein [Bacteroidota bacterium]
MINYPKNRKRLTLLLSAILIGTSLGLTAQPTFNSGQDPRPAGKQWQRIDNLSDEFNDGSLNTAKWEDGPHARFSWTGAAPSIFLPENVTESNGSLNIEHTIFSSPIEVNGLTRLYGGGIVRSKASATVGTYYEARVRAGHTPFSTAFWVINSRGENTTSGCPRTTELDVLECIGRRSTAYSANYAFATNWVGQMHSNLLARESTCPDLYPDNTNLQFTQTLGNGQENWEGYHVYGAWIKSPTEVQFFLDGQPWGGVKTPSVPFDATQMYVTMSSNLYSWNRGLNSNLNDDRIDPQFIVTRNGQQYFDTDADELTAAGKTERSANFDWVRCWRLVDAPTTGSFFILNRETGMKIRQANTEDGQPLESVPSAWSGNPTRWLQIDTDNGYFYLQNVATGNYFRPTNDSDASVLIQRPTSYNGSYTQWRKVTTSNGYFYLQNRATGMYFRPETDATYSLVIQRPTTYTGNWTQWTFVNTGTARLTGELNEPEESTPIFTTHLYPNPITDGLFTIDLRGTTTPARVQVYDILGKLVLEDLIDSGSTQLSLGGKKGVYVVKVETENGTQITKLSVR